MAVNRPRGPDATPAEVLRRWLEAHDNVTQDELADAMGVSRYSVNQLVNGRRGVSPAMALRLAKVMNTSPEFWLNLQRTVDLRDARRDLESEIARIRPLRRGVQASDMFYEPSSE